jgi:ABC-type Zn uptake system ZnuABC Zn-binding protein ZnuA
LQQVLRVYFWRIEDKKALRLKRLRGVTMNSYVEFVKRVGGDRVDVVVLVPQC